MRRCGGGPWGRCGCVRLCQEKEAQSPESSSQAKPNRISTLSFRNYFRGTRSSDFNQPGPMMVLLDFPELIIDRYNVRRLESCTTHFPSTETTYLRELKSTLSHTQSILVNLCVDIEECGPEGTFSSPDPDVRAAAVEAVKSWVDAAHTLGVKSIRVGPGKVDPQNLEPTAEAYKALAAYAQTKHVQVMVENHAGFGAENPEEMVNLFKLTGRERLGAIPDFADFADEPTREKGLKMLFPYAPTLCHAKGVAFDASGAETGYNFPQAMQISSEAGFRGIYSIEYDGPGDPYAGIQKTLDELLRYL